MRIYTRLSNGFALFCACYLSFVVVGLVTANLHFNLLILLGIVSSLFTVGSWPWRRRAAKRYTIAQRRQHITALEYDLGLSDIVPFDRAVAPIEGPSFRGAATPPRILPKEEKKIVPFRGTGYKTPGLPVSNHVLWKIWESKRNGGG